MNIRQPSLQEEYQAACLVVSILFQLIYIQTVRRIRSDPPRSTYRYSMSTGSEDWGRYKYATRDYSVITELSMAIEALNLNKLENPEEKAYTKGAIKGALESVHPPILNLPDDLSYFISSFCDKFTGAKVATVCRNAASSADLERKQAAPKR